MKYDEKMGHYGFVKGNMMNIVNGYNQVPTDFKWILSNNLRIMILRCNISNHLTKIQNSDNTSLPLFVFCKTIYIP